jgi:replication factor C small subunit
MVMNQADNSIWCERYRPVTLENYIGNDHVKAKLKQYITEQDIPHLLFQGKPGTGKTTAAKILVKSIDCDYLFINASDENSVDTIRNKIKGFASTIGFKDLKIIVLDEADFVTPQAQAALRNLMEAFSMNTRFILTCNEIDRIIPPIQSRAQIFDLIPPSMSDVAKHVFGILQKESVECSPADVAMLVKAYYPDIRRIINTAQLQVKSGKLSIDTQQLISSDHKLKMLEILKSSVPRLHKINSVRQVIADARITHYEELYKFLFDTIDEYAEKFGNSDIPEIICGLADGQYRSSFVVDKEIIFIATLTSIIK